MRSFLIVVSLFFTLQIGLAQVKNKFSISFDNAEHHEAKITGTFTNLSEGTVSLVMGRTSTENYALHEFTRNIYDLKITDGKGKNVTITKPNLYQWDVTGHDGTIHIYYTLFADKGNAIYSQIDEIHALINNPSAFMYVPSLKERPVEISYVSRNDLNWKIATPMKSTGTNTYQAANLADFMDSSTLLSNHTIQEYKVGSGNREQTIKMALNHNGSDIEAKELFEKIKRVIDVQKDVFGDYPSFDDNAYHFLVSLMPQMSTGGMGHRNSAVITSSKSITESTINDIVENFAHQFLHSWNKQRIRPVSLESFDYSKLNLLDELWFVDGITEYYANLSLCRAGIITKDEYISDLTQKYNQVWNSSALRHGGPIEMSRKASFLENTEDTRFLNKENTVIPYITYGEVLGLALDLSLRAENDDLNLDEFMKLFWTKYGKTEIRYTTDNIFLTLREYAGASFADHFFSKYIKSNNVPDFNKIL